jgi:hypothetical protein
MNKVLGATFVFCLLAACADQPVVVATAGEQKCIPRDAPTGTHMPSRKCTPTSDEERAKAQAHAEEMRDAYNRANTARSLPP